MSRFRCLLLASLFFSSLPAAKGEAHCPGNVISLTLRLVQSSLIVVPVEINHSGPYDFVVDTGAQVTTVEPTLAAELSLKVQGTTGVGGVATYARTAFAYLDALEAGRHSVPNALAVIQELTQLKGADSRIRGILGANFLEHFDLLIDNGRHLLCLDESGLRASAVKGQHIALAEPRGAQEDFPFTRPIIVSARLSGFAPHAGAPPARFGQQCTGSLLLRRCPAAFAKRFQFPSTLLKRVTDGVEQTFAVLPPQDIQIGKRWVRQVPFVIPKNSSRWWTDYSRRRPSPNHRL